jgi:hypothetical protein
MRLVVTNLCKKRGKGKMKEVALCFEGFYLTRSFCNQHCCCLPGKTDPQEKGGQKKLLCKIEIVYNCIAVNGKESGSLGLYN